MLTDLPGGNQSLLKSRRREQTRLCVLSTGQGLGEQSSKRAWVSASPQAPRDFQSWRAVSGRLYGGAAPPGRGHHPPPLPVSCRVLDARRACLPSSGLQECTKNNINNLPWWTVTFSVSLLSALACHVDSCFPACPVGSTPSNGQSAAWPHSLISNSGMGCFSPVMSGETEARRD